MGIPCLPGWLADSFKPKSDQYLISPYSNIALSFTKIKEMIIIVLINSPCQYRRKFLQKSMEHMNTNFGL